MSSPRLTVVIPLKGRDLFTFRFLWHANAARLPYRFLIADGQVNETIARRLEDGRKLFPALDIDYVRYPDDVDFDRYFGKMADAFGRVRTPYVMNADNDDFLGAAGIERALDFLDAHEDFISARGHQVTFSVYSRVGRSSGSISGSFNKLHLDGDFQDFDASDAAERLRATGLCHKLHYAVYRTDVLARVWQEIADMHFSDLMLFEDFFALRVLTLGKFHVDNRTVTYYTQSGTGISYQPLQDWAGHLLRSRFTSDAHAVIDRIAAATANGHDKGDLAIAEDVRAILADRYRAFLQINYGLPAQIKSVMRRKWPRLASSMQTRPRFSVSRERAAIFSRLKNAGASQQDLKRVTDELIAMERALSAAAFTDYAGQVLPLAVGQGDRENLYTLAK